jgi:dynactin 1
MALNPKEGQTIQTQDGRTGIVRYAGPLHIAAGDWLGLELPDDTGKNDGSVKGERYFQCAMGHGIFVRKESVVKIVAAAPTAKVTKPESRTRVNGSTPTPTPTSASNLNGAATKPRPSMSADVARKRQSLMSQGSGSAGSRLSVRVSLT